jgi:hypothetical protein
MLASAGYGNAGLTRARLSNVVLTQREKVNRIELQNGLSRKFAELNQ